MILNEAELKSAVWQKIAAYCEERIAILQRELENDLDERKTAIARGRLREARKLLSIPKENMKIAKFKQSGATY